MEDYLKAIYHLRGGRGPAAAKEVAREMSVSPSTVTSMLKKLSQLRLIRYTPYRGVELTAAGEKVALEVIRHHRLLELFLQEVLGYRLSQVHDEAERLEHTLSDELEERISSVLGHPLTDPHGSPIPRPDGTLVERPQVPLTDLEPGQHSVVTGLLSRNPDQLSYLEGIGLTPGAPIRLLEKRPLNGPLSVEIGQGRQEVIGHELARQVLVGPPGTEVG